MPRRKQPRRTGPAPLSEAQDAALSVALDSGDLDALATILEASGRRSGPYLDLFTHRFPPAPFPPAEDEYERALRRRVSAASLLRL